MEALGVLLFAVAAVVLFQTFRGRRSEADYTAISAALGRGAPLLDVRSAAEFQRGHLPRATNIPAHELAHRLGELGEGQPVVVYCASGARSRSAAGTLRARGFAEVLDLGPMRNHARLPPYEAPAHERPKKPARKTKKAKRKQHSKRRAR